MNRQWTGPMVLVAVLVVSGCSSGGPVGAAPAATAPASPTTTQVMTPPPRASTATPAGATASPSTPSRVTPSRVTPSPQPSPVSESEFCHTVMGQTRPAVTALKKLAKHPDGHGLTVRELSAPRDRLHDSEGTAPQHLRGYLHTQVAILSAAVRQVESGKKKHVPVAEFVDAKTEFILDCEMAE